VRFMHREREIVGLFKGLISVGLWGKRALWGCIENISEGLEFSPTLIACQVKDNWVGCLIACTSFQTSKETNDPKNRRSGRSKLAI
jgi:hypothetical protein